MSPEPSFTQTLREEGFIQGSDVVSKVNEVKEEVVNQVEEEVQQKVEETKTVIEETVEEQAQATVNNAKSFAEEKVQTTSNDSIIGKLIDTIKNIF